MTRRITNVAASVRQRLLNHARATGRPFNEVAQHYVIERFLYRFSQTPHTARFVLKGAQMLRVWAAPLTRPTLDIDMLAQVANTSENLRRIMREAVAVPVADDGLSFDADGLRVEAIAKNAIYQGVRLLVPVALDTMRLQVQVDCGFGDAVWPAPTWVELSDVLGLGVPRLLGYTPASMVAEKFQAMVALDMANSRLKDFYDLWTLAGALEFDGETLRQALSATFTRRGTPLPVQPPVALTAQFTADLTKQALWQAFLRKGRLSVGGHTLAEVGADLAHFLLPPARAASFPCVWRGGHWQPLVAPDEADVPRAS